MATFFTLITENPCTALTHYSKKAALSPNMALQKNSYPDKADNGTVKIHFQRN